MLHGNCEETKVAAVNKYIDQFKKIAGDAFVMVDEESLNHYAHDETENLHFLPDVVIKPTNC